MSDGGTITVSNNQLVIATYKPKVVEMHTRDNLERFVEQAEATGVGLQWNQWRFSIEIGSATYIELLKTGEISQARHGEIMRDLGLGSGPRVKHEPEEDDGEPARMLKLAKMAKQLGVKLDLPEQYKILEAGEAPVDAKDAERAAATARLARGVARPP
jgi:hypothetical protein